MDRFLFAFALVFATSTHAQPPVVETAFRALQQAAASAEPEAIEVATARMLDAANAHPDHPAALVGIGNSAHAFATLGRWESAEHLWQRVVDEGMPRLGREPDEQMVTTVADALAQLARRAAARGDWAAATSHYRTLADSALFERSDATGMRERVADALNGAADALEREGEYERAARYLLRAAERELRDFAGPERLDHAAELFVRAGEWADAVRTSERILMLYGRSRIAALVIMRAHERIVRSLERRGARAERIRAARVQVVTAFERLDGSPGSDAAALAARQALALIAPGRLRVVARGGSERARVRSFERSLASAAGRLAEAIEGYEHVLTYRAPESSLAALVAIGDRASELADAVERARVPASVREGPARELRCRALRSYRLAGEVAAAARLSLPTTAATAIQASPAGGC